MSTAFFRDHGRYIVHKRKRLSMVDECAIDHSRYDYAAVESVVIESDSPIYEETWDNLQRTVEGRPTLRAERDALAEELSAQGPFPIDGDDRGHSGDIILAHRNGTYRVTRAREISGDRTASAKGHSQAYQNLLRVGYTHWMPLSDLKAMVAERLSDTIV